MLSGPMGLGRATLITSTGRKEVKLQTQRDGNCFVWPLCRPPPPRLLLESCAGWIWRGFVVCSPVGSHKTSPTPGEKFPRRDQTSLSVLSHTAKTISTKKCFSKRKCMETNNFHARRRKNVEKVAFPNTNAWRRIVFTLCIRIFAAALHYCTKINLM